MLQLKESLVRPYLEYFVDWSPHYSLEDDRYKEKVNRLGLFSQQQSRLRDDLIEVYTNSEA